jgi:hypothetical protein
MDELVKSHQSRHPGGTPDECGIYERGSEVLVFPGFRLSPE